MAQRLAALLAFEGGQEGHATSAWLLAGVPELPWAWSGALLLAWVVVQEGPSRAG